MAKDPIKFTDAKRQAYLDALSEQGLGRCAAAKAAGVSRETVSDYIKDHPEFADLRDEAELLANEKVESALFQAATTGKSVTAMQVWLYNRMPGRWKDQRRPDHGDEGHYAAVDLWVAEMKGEPPA